MAEKASVTHTTVYSQSSGNVNHQLCYKFFSKSSFPIKLAIFFVEHDYSLNTGYLFCYCR